MSRPSRTVAPPSLAHRLVQDLLRLDAPTVDTPAESLSRVRSLVCFLKDFRAPVPLVPVPAGTSPSVPLSCPFWAGQILTQRPPPAGQLPAYSFPLVGQPVRMVGAPVNGVVPDGALWGDETGRWVCEDMRVVFNTPAGPMVTSVDSGAFEEWDPSTASTPAETSAMLDEARALLEALERDILASVADQEEPAT